MKQSLEYVLSLGIDGNVFEKLPSLFSCSVEENLKPKVEYITKELELPMKIFEKQTSLFGYSIESNIKPTYNYLTKEIGSTNADLEKSPIALGYSLEKRIKPRWEFAKSKNKTSNPLGLLPPGDPAFARKMGCELKEYLDFKEEYLATA